jgi:hypothetical protein
MNRKEKVGKETRGEYILDQELACRSLSGLLQISPQGDLSYTKWQSITPALTTKW